MTSTAAVIYGGSNPDALLPLYQSNGVEVECAIVPDAITIMYYDVARMPYLAIQTRDVEAAERLLYVTFTEELP